MGTGEWNPNGNNIGSKTLISWQRSKVAFDIGEFNDPLNTND